MHQRHKPRLQVALYARPKHPDKHHFALLVAPKVAARWRTVKHHVKNTLQIDADGSATTPWRYERIAVADVEEEQRLLVIVTIAKVLVSWERVDEILENVPVYQSDDPEKPADASFNCLSWVESAFVELREQKAIDERVGDWSAIERQANEYVEKKREEGRWDGGSHGSEIPLLDLIESREVVG